MLTFSDKTGERQKEGSVPMADTSKSPGNSICWRDKRTQWPDTFNEQNKELEMAEVRPQVHRIPNPSAHGSGQVEGAATSGALSQGRQGRTNGDVSLLQHHCKEPDTRQHFCSRRASPLAVCGGRAHPRPSLRFPQLCQFTNNLLTTISQD